MPEQSVVTTGIDAAGDHSLRRLIGRGGRNLLVSAAGQLAIRLFGLATLIIVARYFDPALFGRYTVLLTYYAIALVLGSFGLERLTVRDLAIGGDSSGRLFGTLLTLRTLSGIFTAIVLCVIGLIVQPGEPTAVFLLASAMLPAAVAESYAGGFHARQDFGPPARAGVLAAGAGLTVAAVGALLHAELSCFVAGVLVSELVRAFSLAVAARREMWARSIRFDPKLSQRAIRSALPYGVLALMGMIYFRIDVVMLDAMIGGAAVGHYGAAYRILEAAAAIPGLVMSVLFPRFAVLQQTDLGIARQLYLSATRLMLVLGTVIGGGVIVLAAPIVKVMFTDAYAPAVPTLTWLMLALVVLFWHAPNATVLFSRLRLRSAVAWSCVTLAFNVAANWMLIPRHGASGAAAATVASEVLSLIIFTPLVCSCLKLGAAQYFRTLFSVRSPRSQLDLLLDRDDLSPGSMR